MEHKFFLSQDQDSHWYIIPAEFRKEWNEWVNLDQDTEEAWDAPEWAYRVGGDPSQVEFENPAHNGILI